MTANPLVKQFLDHRDVLLGFLFALTRDMDAAEEVFQETALVIMEEAGRATEVVNFMAWAREIARRRLKEYYRRHSRGQQMQMPLDALAEVVDQAFAEHAATEGDGGPRMQHLLECIEKLAGRSRQVIEGFYRQRKSIRAIAADLAWEENSVKVALSRARKSLADCVQLRLRAQGT